MLRIKLMRSTVAHQWRTQRVVESLGLRKINQVVEHDDTPVIRGMIHRVKELIQVEELEGTPTKKKISRPGSAGKTATAEKPAKAAAKPKVAAEKVATPKAETASEEKPKKKATKKSEDK